MTMLECARCAATHEVSGDEHSALTALAWVSAVERGRNLRFCPACSRENLRAIEGQLDLEHW